MIIQIRWVHVSCATNGKVCSSSSSSRGSRSSINLIEKNKNKFLKEQEEEASSSSFKEEAFSSTSSYDDKHNKDKRSIEMEEFKIQQNQQNGQSPIIKVSECLERTITFWCNESILNNHIQYRKLQL